jgi:DNA-binding XRE family transcriptional regulator
LWAILLIGIIILTVKKNHSIQSTKNKYRSAVRRCRLKSEVVSQAELGRRTGIDRTTLSAIENNRMFLSIHYALLIKEALGCSLDDLYTKSDADNGTERKPGYGSSDG